MQGKQQVKQKIRAFTDLLSWQKAHRLAVAIYRATQLFPKHELFGLTSQIRRAAISISSNIAEGFSRSSWAEKVQFYSISLGSLTELHSQLLLAYDLSYMSQDEFDILIRDITDTHKLIRGLIKHTKIARDS